jgi:flagellar basal body-associated protein FliL
MKRRRIDDTDETLDIPDFIEDKTITDSSTSVDMSIFKMSDDELYDDTATSDNDLEDDDDYDELRPKKKRKGNTPMIICLVLIVLLLAGCIGSLVYALKQHQALVKTKTEYLQVQANEENYKRQIQEKDETISALTKQIEELKEANKKGEGNMVYVVVDGPISFRVKPDSNSDATTYKNESYAYNDEQFNVIEVVAGENDSSYSWAKIAENVYFCLGTADDVWAKKAD